MNNQKNSFEKIDNWILNSVTLKIIIIAIIGLLLLIPAVLIKEIIHEREQLNNQATEEVSSKWAGNQKINGPVLTIPLVLQSEIDGKIVTTTKQWYLLPENLSIEGDVEPQKLKRGIYEVIVYTTHLAISGNFNITQPPVQPDLKEILYDQSFLTIGISDLRGIEDEINFKWNQQDMEALPGSRISGTVYSGLTLDVPYLENLEGGLANFEFDLDLRGSQNLSFVPSGSATDVKLSSSWASPSFGGNFLPDTREIDHSGFQSSWSVLQLNRNFPQSWIDKNYFEEMEEASFGIDFILPLDDYQKSMRSIKYAAMTIGLTFLIFFLAEIHNKAKIHPIQYAMVGLALCLFYSLLVSISEHTGFNLAYGISTLGIVAMVAAYSMSIFRSRLQTILLVVALLVIYGFLFVNLQVVDYALLLGSVGLTAILAGAMYFTRKINWYRLKIDSE